MAFNTSTREVMERLGHASSKTLFRRRVDYADQRVPADQKFLIPGVHFQRKSPGSMQLVWDWQKTKAAWEQALRVADLLRAQAQLER